MKAQDLMSYTGFTLACLGIAILAYMAFRAMKVSKESDEEQRAQQFQKLIVLNFVGLSFGIIGAVMLIIGKIL